MKKFAKVALIMVAAVALVACSILGTLAYLQAQSKVATNTFTVGKVAISLNEAKVDEYGVPVESAERVLANEYKLIAGHTYTKDPTVTVAANSEESYVRMIVTITDIVDLKAACGVEGQFMPGAFVGGWDSAKWECVNGYLNDDDTAVYVFNYTKTVDTTNSEAETLDALFKTFTLPANATNEQIEALNNLRIDVQAFAIQADGFENAADAWAAFPTAN